MTREYAPASTEMPTISIIVAVYNVADYVEECVRCLLGQTYRNLEVVIVDDGSSDGSGAICDGLQAADPRVIVVHKDNGGLSDARNAGLRRSSGELVMFVDGDDLVSPDLVEHLYNVLESTGADVSICDPCHMEDGDAPAYVAHSKVEELSAEEAIEEMLYQTSFLFSACAKLFKSSLLDKEEFPVGKLYEDVAVMGRVFDRADLIAYSDAKLYAYRHRADSITTSRFSVSDLDILEHCRLYEKYADQKSESLRQAALTYRINCELRVYLNTGSDAAFLNSRREAVRFILSHWKEVRSNPRARAKLKIALWLFVFARPVLEHVYRFVPRWT